MRVGDKLKFKKFNWVIIKKIKHHSGVVEFKYRVYRKYLKNLISLSNTDSCYPISQWRWNFLKNKLSKNPNYHYNMSLWSNNSR